MNKIINHLKENWIRHGFETLVVVVGILVAFTLNNWNEEKKLRTKERDLLLELKSNLETNVTNLNRDIESQIRGAVRIDFLIDHLENQRPYHDSLAAIFLFIDVVPDIILASSAFETLKSSGLHILSSDKLRQEIIDLFQITYPYLLQDTRRLEDQVWPSVVLPLYQKHFRYTNGAGAVPTDYDQLLADEEFVNMLSFRGVLRQASTTKKQEATLKTMAVVDIIEQELNASK